MNQKKAKVNKHILSKPSHIIVSRQQTVHSSQLRLQLEDLTVQVANLREDRVFLVSILQHHVIVLQTPHIGLQLLNASLNILPAMLQLHLLQQRLIAFLVRTLPPPSVTNRKELATHNYENRI